MHRRQLLCLFAAAPLAVVPSNLIMRSPIARKRKPGIDYARAEETPNWERQRVIDLDTGREVEYDVKEVDCVDGWALCWRRLKDKRVGTLGASHDMVIIRGCFRLELID